MFGAHDQSLWTGSDIYRATPAVTPRLDLYRTTRDFGFKFQFHPKDHHIQSSLNIHKRMWRIYCNSHGLSGIKSDLYPNILAMLFILISIPVSIASANDHAAFWASSQIMAEICTAFLFGSDDGYTAGNDQASVTASHLHAHKDMKMHIKH
jgi:hypothetical protein